MSKINSLHSWEVQPVKARQIQEQLRSQVKICPLPTNIRSVAGIDVSYNRGSDILFAAVVVLAFPDLKVIEIATASQRIEFPYIPGLLSFREGPVVLAAWEKLEVEPNVVIFDGHGLAHPRRFGLATHLGLILDKPAIGCAKSRLIGKYVEPGQKRGDYSVLVEQEEIIGRVLRTRTNVKLVFISIGHKANLPGCRQLLLDCGRGLRLPEPTRQAHLAVNKFRREYYK